MKISLRLFGLILLLTLLLLLLHCSTVSSASPPNTFFPTPIPTSIPTPNPTEPSSQPSRQPSSQPSRLPTRQPSSQPSTQPSSVPSANPTPFSGIEDNITKTVCLWIGLSWIVALVITWISEYKAGQKFRKDLQTKENSEILKSYGNLKKLARIAPDPISNASFIETKNNKSYIKDYVHDYFNLILRGSLSSNIVDLLSIFHTEVLENHMYVSIVGSNRIGSKRWVTIFKLLTNLTFSLGFITFCYDRQLPKNDGSWGNCFSYTTQDTCLGSKTTSKFDSSKHICMWRSGVCSFNDSADFFDNYAFIVILLIVAIAMGPISFCLDYIFHNWLSCPNIDLKDKFGRMLQKQLMESKIEEEVKKGIDILYLELNDERKHIVSKGDIEKLLVFDAQWGIKITKTSSSILTNLMVTDHQNMHENHDYNQVKFIYTDNIIDDMKSLMLEAVEMKFCLETESEQRIGIELFVSLFTDILGKHTMAARVFRQKVFSNLNIYYSKSSLLFKSSIIFLIILVNIGITYGVVFACQMRSKEWLRTVLSELFCYIFVDAVIIEFCKLFFVHYYNVLLVNAEILEARNAVNIAADLMVKSLESEEGFSHEGDKMVAEFSAARYIFLTSYLSIFFPQMLESALAKFVVRKLPEKNGLHWSSQNYIFPSFVSSFMLAMKNKNDNIKKRRSGGGKLKNTSAISTTTPKSNSVFDYNSTDENSSRRRNNFDEDVVDDDDDMESFNGSEDDWFNENDYMTINEYIWEKIKYCILFISSRFTLEQQRFIYHLSIPPLIYAIVVFVYFLISSIRIGVYIIVLIVLLVLAVCILKKIYSTKKNSDDTSEDEKTEEEAEEETDIVANDVPNVSFFSNNAPSPQATTPYAKQQSQTNSSKNNTKVDDKRLFSPIPLTPSETKSRVPFSETKTTVPFSTASSKQPITHVQPAASSPDSYTESPDYYSGKSDEDNAAGGAAVVRKSPSPVGIGVGGESATFRGRFISDSFADQPKEDEHVAPTSLPKMTLFREEMKDTNIGHQGSSNSYINIGGDIGDKSNTVSENSSSNNNKNFIDNNINSYGNSDVSKISSSSNINSNNSTKSTLPENSADIAITSKEMSLHDIAKSDSSFQNNDNARLSSGNRSNSNSNSKSNLNNSTEFGSPTKVSPKYNPKGKVNSILSNLESYGNINDSFQSGNSDIIVVNGRNSEATSVDGSPSLFALLNYEPIKPLPSSNAGSSGSQSYDLYKDLKNSVRIGSKNSTKSSGKTSKLNSSK